MKYILFILTAALIAGLFAFQPVDEQLLPTKLRITVIDGLGNPVEGATVKIFKTQDDYIASENPVQSASSDKKGRVTFKDVKTISYFIEAKLGDKNNNGEGVKTEKLTEGRINKVNTVIE